MAQIYTVTASTSVVLISTVQSPDTVVLLSSVNFPGHLVTIQDITNSPLLQSQPIIVSTTSGIHFADGTSSFLINQPLGQATVSSRDPFQWYLLNNKGFLSQLSNAFLDSLSVDYLFTNVISTQQENVSTMNAGNMLVTNTLTLLGEAQLQGNFSVEGNMDVFSSLRIQGSLNLSSILEVGGPVSLASTLTVKDNVFLLDSISTLENVVVGETVSVSSLVRLSDGALLPKELSIQTARLRDIDIGGELEVVGWISTLGDARIREEIIVGQSTIVNQILRVEDSLYIQGSTNIETLLTCGSLSTYQESLILGSLFVGGDATFLGPVSTSGSLVSLSSILTTGSTIVQKTISSQSLEAYDLKVLNNVFTSSLSVPSLSIAGSFLALGSSLTMSTILASEQSTFIGGDLIVLSSLHILNEISVGKTLFVGSDFTSLSTFSVGNTLFVGGNLTASEWLIKGNVSTFEVSSATNITVVEDVIGGLLSTFFLGAQIDVSVSSFILSDTLLVSTLIAPLVEIEKYTSSNSIEPRIWVGEEPFDSKYNLYVEGVLRTDESVLAENIQIVSTQSEFLNVARSNFFSLGSYSTIQSTIFVYLMGGESGGFLSNYPAMYVSLDLDNWEKNIIQTNFIFSDESPEFTEIRNIANNNDGLWVATNNFKIFYTKNLTQWQTLSPNINYFSFLSLTNGLVNGISSFAMIGTSCNFTGNEIIISQDAIQWSTILNNFESYLPQSLKYFPDPNVWVIGGIQFNTNEQFPYPIIYSLDGLTWQSPTIWDYPNQDIYIVDIAYGNGVYVAVGFDFTFTNLSIRYTTDITTWNQVGIFGSEFSFILNSIAFGNNLFVTTNGNEIWTSSDGQTFTYQGFLGETTKLSFQNGYFLATGNFNSGTTSLLYSINGINWTPANNASFAQGPGVVRGTAYDIEYGFFQSNVTGITVNNSNYDVDPIQINLPSYFQQNLSVNQIIAETVTASSFTGFFTGDGSQLTNATNIAATGKTSTATVEIINTINYFAEKTFVSTMDVQDSIQISTAVFQSVEKFYLAGGIDIFANGKIQESQDSDIWIRTQVSGLDACVAIVGNNDPINPIYVATGVASQSQDTIQWSTDGIFWNPVGTFVFDPAERIAVGLGLAYSPTLKRFIALGYDPLELGRTLYYSDDGKTWILCSGTLPPRGSKPPGFIFKAVYWASSIFIVISEDKTYTSTDGINWIEQLQLAETTFQDVKEGQTITSGQNIAFLAPFGLFFFGQQPNESILENAIPEAGTNIDFTANTSFLLTNPSFTSFTSFVPQGLNDPIGINKFEYNGSYWLGFDEFYADEQLMFSSINLSIWEKVELNGIFPAKSFIKSAYWDTVGSQWLVGLQTEDQTSTIWKSANLVEWNNATSGGFSSGISEVGIGYGFIQSNARLYAFGDGFADTPGRLDPLILEIDLTKFPPAFVGNYIIQNSLTSIRGMAGAFFVEPFPFVITGFSRIQTRTIARSEDFTTFQNAIIGGFSTTGYAATYVSQIGAGLYFAAGEANPINTIQYSADGNTWFGANTSLGIRKVGYGLAVTEKGDSFNPAGVERYLVAVGEDISTDSNRTIILNYISTPGIVDPFSANSPTRWTTIQSGGFLKAGHAVAAGIFSLLGNFGAVAVGDQNGVRAGTIKWSTDMSNWVNSIGGFNVRGLGVASAKEANSLAYVAVGEDTDPNFTIQYSTDGGQTFSPIAGNGFTKRGNGVIFTYFNNNPLWFATGEDINGEANKTIKYSPNGINWTNLDFGFDPLYSLGAALTFYSQTLDLKERNPFLESSNLVIYERSNIFINLLQTNTIRTQENQMTWNETLTFTSSSQVLVACNTSFTDETLLTTRSLYASSIVFSDDVDIGNNLIISSLLVSTVHANLYAFSNTLNTSTLGIGGIIGFENQIAENQALPPNFIFTANDFLGLNLALFVDKQAVGIEQSSISFTLFNDYTTAASTLEAQDIFTQTTQFTGTTIDSQDPVLSSRYLDIYLNDQSPSQLTKNTIQVTPSTLAFNSTLYLNLSSQRVGIFTPNPLFDLHVEGLVIVSSISTTNIKVGSFSFLSQFF